MLGCPTIAKFRKDWYSQRAGLSDLTGTKKFVKAIKHDFKNWIYSYESIIAVACSYTKE